MRIQLPRLKKLTTGSYEIDQIQSFTDNLTGQLNNYISSLSTQQTILGLVNPLTFNAVNTYVIFPSIVYDAFSTYDIITGSFTSPVTGLVQISVNIFAVAGASSTMQLVGQINKSAIDPSATTITNYDFNLASVTNATTATLAGKQTLQLNKGDVVRLIFTTSANPVSFPNTPYNPQVSFTW